jgi:hypothetical protein
MNGADPIARRSTAIRDQVLCAERLTAMLAFRRRVEVILLAALPASSAGIAGRLPDDARRLSSMAHAAARFHADLAADSCTTSATTKRRSRACAR